MHAGSDPVSRQPSPTLHALTPDISASLREVAVQQLVRAAQELADRQLERASRVGEDGTRRAVCSICYRPVANTAYAEGHGRNCPVGRIRQAVRDLLTFSQNCSVVPCDPAGEGEAPAGSFLHEGCFLPGAVCGAPDCTCDAVTRCVATTGCNFPNCNCSEESRCAESYPAAAQGGAA